VGGAIIKPDEIRGAPLRPAAAAGKSRRSLHITIHSEGLAMVVSSQMRPGMVIRHEGQTYRVIAAEYHPGQGRMGGCTHARLQNIETRTFWEHSFRPDLRFEELPLEKKGMEFLYSGGDLCCFMDPETFEQADIPLDLVGPQASFLEPGMRVSVESLHGRPVNVIFPGFMEVRISDTAPPQHQQHDTSLKPARTANGTEIMVPQFIKTGDVIRVDLQTMKYMDRVKSRGA
jgi:elongation factor P